MFRYVLFVENVLEFYKKRNGKNLINKKGCPTANTTLLKSLTVAGFSD